MASTMKAFIDKIMQDTEKNTRGIVNGAAKKARVDFTKEAKRWMDNYYSEYSSDNYERTDTLRDYGYAPYTLWNANKIQTGVRFTDRGADFSKVYNRDVGAKDGWGAILLSEHMAGQDIQALLLERQLEKKWKNLKKHIYLKWILISSHKD